MTDLGLDLAPRTSGRAASPVEVTFVRELLPADIAMLSTERGVKAPSIKRIRDSHHSLAKALAFGMKPTEASAVTGYSLSRISILQDDPMFQELMSHYRAEKNSATADVQGRMVDLALEATEELRERLHDNPEDFDIDDLVLVAKTNFDRAGFGPATKQTNVNVNVNLAGRLEAARKRAAETVPNTVPAPGGEIEGPHLVDLSPENYKVVP